MSVIDGISGKPITNPLTSSVATFDSPLSISMEGRGNDLFLFWLGDCLSHEGRTEQFASVDPGVFDSCRLRFKTRETHQLCITNRARKGACQSMLEAGQLCHKLMRPPTRSLCSHFPWKNFQILPYSQNWFLNLKEIPVCPSDSTLIPRILPYSQN